MLLFLASCAQLGRLTGGDKDEAAPTMDMEKTVPLPGRINFKGDRITLYFEEFFSFNNAKQNIVINPPFEKGKEPEYKMVGKKLLIKFNDSLKENTTYNISFNRAVKDIKEKNDSLFQFAFSTGPFLDSMSVKGKILDAYTNQPSKGITVMMYEELSDSTPYKETPTYFTQTDEKGNFAINYIKDGKYLIFALEDQNRNNLYDLSTEGFSFLSNHLIFSEDSIKQSGVLFRMSKITPDDLYIEEYEHEFPGALSIKFNKDVQNFNIKKMNGEDFRFSLDLKSEDDSLICWIPPVVQDTLYLKILENDTIIDTLKLYMRYLGKGANAEIGTPEFKLQSNAQPSLHYYDTLELTSTLPLGFIDESKIIILDKDSVQVADTKIKFNYRKITIYGDWKPKETYRITLLDSAVVSKYGFKNDSNTIFFNKQQSDYYGNLFVNLRVAEEGNYIFELLNEQNKLIRTVELSESSRIKFELLAPGKYKFRLIKDENNNGKWDPGNFMEKLQPERVFYLEKSVSMRSNWDQDVDWTIKSYSSDDSKSPDE